MGAFRKGMGDLVTQDMEKVETLRDGFASIFTGSSSVHTAHTAQAKAGPGRMKNHPLWEEIRFETT